MYKFPDHKIFKWHTYITISTQYFCSFGIMLLVPIDLVTTITGRKENNKEYYHKNINIITETYLTLYWLTLILSNIILIVQEEYNFSGFLKLKDKIKDVIIQFGYQSIVGILSIVIFFGIIVGCGIVSPNIDAILLTLILLTNTIGLLMLMVLLGYGLVVFPQIIWNYGNYNYRLNRVKNKAMIQYNQMNDCKFKISMCISNIRKTQEELKIKTIQNKKFKKENEDISHMVEIMNTEAPKEFTSSTLGKVLVDEETNKITLKKLASERKKMLNYKQIYLVSVKRVEIMENNAYWLEDVINAINSNKNLIVWTFQENSQNKLIKKLEYCWYILILPIIFKILGVCFLGLSILSYIGVIGTIHSIPLDFSVYFITIHNKNITGSQIIVFVFFTLGYVYYVVFWTLFEIKLSGIMELVDNTTSQLSMSFNVRMVARLSAPLAFFYLGWVHENQIISGNFQDSKDADSEKLYTAFSKFYKINVIPIVGGPFNTLFPIIMICISFLTLTNMINRILVYFNFDYLQFGQIVMSEKMINDGELKLKNKKEFRLREYNRNARKNILKNIQDKKILIDFSFFRKSVNYFKNKLKNKKKFNNGYKLFYSDVENSNKENYFTDIENYDKFEDFEDIENYDDHYNCDNFVKIGTIIKSPVHVDKI